MDKEKWLVFHSGDEKEIQEIEELMKDYPEIEFLFVNESPMLKGMLKLPFVETGNGLRMFGFLSIINYLVSLKKYE